MPPYILDYKSMVAHAFIVDNKEKMLLYNLRFNKKHNETIILPAPLLFDLIADNFLVTPEAVYALEPACRALMTHKYRGSIVVLSVSRSVEPNEEHKEMKAVFSKVFSVNTEIVGNR